MFLKNYFIMCKDNLDYRRSTPTNNDNPGLVLYGGSEITDMNRVYDTYIGTYMMQLTQLNKLCTSQGEDAGVSFGTGNTPPSFDDYALSGDAVTSVSFTLMRQCEVDDNGCTLTCVYTITNTGSEDVTIGEVGIWGRYDYYYSSGNRRAVYPLIERTVLDTPVTIPAGGVGQVTYTIRMNYPTA